MFCTQQSPQAQAALQEYKEREGGRGGTESEILILGQDNTDVTTDSDSVLVLGADGVLRSKSDAALRAGEALGGALKINSTLTSLSISGNLSAAVVENMAFYR